MSLILKQQHWRYTLISVFAVVPIVITAFAVVSEWVIDLKWGRIVIDFILNQPASILVVVWIVLPLISWYFAHQAYNRGTINRWRTINYITRSVAIIGIVAVSLIAVAALI